MCGEHLKNFQFPIFYVFATHRKGSEALLCVDLNAFFLHTSPQKENGQEDIETFLENRERNKSSNLP